MILPLWTRWETFRSQVPRKNPGILHNNGSKLDFWKIASDDENYMIEDTGNFMNKSDVKSNFTYFLFYALFREINRFRDFEFFNYFRYFL